ncbi:peptide ABC transporter substrate-binding protein [Clostridium magnum]|uniref:Oligopeptide-binding protein OppA n=1 Tax=Clostridium magnum DSM 2767 TaxID=1121326 RepID=A0A168DY13_9CLOT|nr:peptide ABC transporter substrate-binding protein [Clostridium magnum]KZL93424.1 oligopeptide-binding protein OppA precursor [Clostridium magnum DSM 2767]SHJ31504.1 peptide/nickel transport system substrate-binding protein [Clostridium magnum DSM 2767]
MKRFICCILILSIMFSSGCVEKSVQGNKNEELKDYMVYNLGKAPEDLIMLESYDLRQQDLLVNLFEGLVSEDDKGKINPAIAESWVLSNDDTCYTFKIRENAKWSDGSDINAEDFVTFFSELLSKDIDNRYAEQLYYIFGAEDYRKGKCDFNDVAVRAIDKKNLEIRLNYPCNYFLNILSQPIYSLRKLNDSLKTWKKDYKDILYSGSFIIDDLSYNNDITLKKNINYWNEDSIKSNEILLTCIDGSEATLAAFENNKIDLFTNPPISEFKDLVNSGKAQTASSSDSSLLIFNLKKEGIVRDINLRKAISIGIDRSNIANEILNGTVKEALSYIPSNISDGMSGKFINKVFFKKDLEKETAQSLISNSEYEKNKQTLKLIYLDTLENKKTCEGIAKKLNENLKIKIECQGYEQEEFSEEIKKKDYDMAKIDCEGNYDYPLSFLEQWISSSDINFYGYKNIQFDEKVIKAKMEKDKIKKIELSKEAENILMEDVPVVPLYFYNNIICKKDSIEGIYTTNKGNIKLDKVSERK